MKISEITIADTFGTKLCKFTPGSVTRITGPNGSGKSSVLRALSKVFDGGHDPSVIRAGAEKSVVEIKLDDGTVITKTTLPVKRRKGDDGPVRYRTDLEILDSNGEPRNAPQTYINDLGEAVAIDPGQILRIDATTAPGRKQLAEVLLRIMPITFEPADIGRACRIRSSADVPRESPDALALTVEDRALDLDGLKKFAAQATELRRRVGQTRDDSDGAVNRLKQSLPESDGEDWNVKLTEAERYQGAVNKAIFERKTEIEAAKRDAIATATSLYSTAVQEINGDIDAKIRALELERHERISAMATVKEAATQTAQATAIQELAELDAESKPELEKATADIATAKERLAAHHRAGALRDEIETQLKTCRDAHWKYDQLTDVLARLEGLRAEKLKSLPIPDLVVEGDQVLLAGIPWQNVNTAKRVEVALQLCTLRAGKLGLLLLDDGEHMDSETRLLLEQEIARAGFQLIEAIVSDAEGLSIETVDLVAA